VAPVGADEAEGAGSAFTGALPATVVVADDTAPAATDAVAGTPAAALAAAGVA